MGAAITRGIAGVAGGLVVWMLVATLGNLGLRFAWTGYADVEKEMTFTLAMLFGRLAVGAVASFFAGAVVSWIAKRNNRVVAIFAGVLFALFIPVHYELWSRFPLWYHVAFFVSLIVMPLIGALLYRRVAG
jgi:Na+/H+ antiporter NhaA